MRQRRRGFTLIELLVVIGIILALIGILIIGFRHISAVAAHKETIAELHIARGMLTEYETHAGLNFIKIVYPSQAVTPYPAIGPIVGDESNRLAGSMRYADADVLHTASLMLILEQVPANRNLMQTVQSKRILEPAPGANAMTMDQAGAVLLDGWGNPIILVPASGLTVNIINQANPTGTPLVYIVRTSGTYLKASVPLLTPADRPFFASAGQDGDFSIGEDNVYSFQD